MAITTLLAGLVARKWGYALPAVLAVNGFFLVIDLIFLSANSVKLFEGGWFPLLLAGAVAFLMLTWRKGNACMERARMGLRQPEGQFLDDLRREPPTTLPGAAAFLSSATEGIPLPMMRVVERLGALHARVVIVTALFEETPTVPCAERARVTEITPEIRRVVLRYGFMQSASVPEGLDCAVRAGLLPKNFAEDLTVFVGHETIIPVSDRRGMSDWREAVFAVMQNNAERTGAHFCVPARQVIEIGTEIEI
jgi:KUP system potassium uptake protein